MEFRNLAESKFENKMQPLVSELLRKIYSFKSFVPAIAWRQDDKYGDWLDKNNAVDGKVYMSSLNYSTFQSKVRTHNFLTDPNVQTNRGYADLTLEVENGNGTEGEYYHLYAQHYIYSWVNEDETNIEAWILIDTLKLRYIIDTIHGGINHVGESKINDRCGKAKFRAIPLYMIKDAIKASSGLADGWDSDPYEDEMLYEEIY